MKLFEILLVRLRSCPKLCSLAVISSLNVYSKRSLSHYLFSQAIEMQF